MYEERLVKQVRNKMENTLKTKIKHQQKRKLRVRKALRGSALKPRMCVVKTNKHIHIQLIDDIDGLTLVSASTIEKSIRGTDQARKSKENAKTLGMNIAKQAIEKKIEAAIFDRGKNKYHGILAEVAEGAREGGLKL